MHKQITDQDDPSIPPPSPQTPSHSQSPPAWQSNHDTPKNKMEKTMYKYSTEDEENDDIAVRSVLEMGYSRPTVHSVIEQLRKQGKSNHTATDIMEIILDQEERRASAPSTTTNTNTIQTPSQTGASKLSKTSIASTDYQSLLKENQTLKEQMLCKICLDKDASMVYLPCGHMVTCKDCAPTIRKCCICRKMIQGTVKAYL